jgi:type I site-specific restriction endonuclease
MPSATVNQNPEQIARDQIDAKLAEAGWCVQDKGKIDFNAGQGIAVREYPNTTHSPNINGRPFSAPCSRRR